MARIPLGNFGNSTPGRAPQVSQPAGAFGAGAAAALEAALIQGVSRFRDPGRGQGLAGIKRYLSRWDGKISIRSGTARLSIVPKWDDDVPLAENLPFFPGSQVQVVIPAQEGGAR